MPYITDPVVEAYAEAHTTPPPPYLADLAAETQAKLALPGMMVGPLEGRFLEMLVYACKARLVLEIGTFSGYSSLSMASGLPPGGRIITCELDPVHAEMARRHIAASPHAERIQVMEGQALDTLKGLSGPFDFVFIDADKPNYINYYEAVLPKLAADGLIAVDNTLWGGSVVDGSNDRPDSQVMKAFNDHVVQDSRVVGVQVPIRDGVTLIRPVG